jgi:hypothetical protein
VAQLPSCQYDNLFQNTTIRRFDDSKCGRVQLVDDGFSAEAV